MRRAAFVLASVLAAAVVAGAALFYGSDSPPVSTAPDALEAVQPQQMPSTATQPSGSESPLREAVPGQSQQPPSSNVNDEIRRRRMPEPDEATVRADMRKQATQDVQVSYSLLLEDLDVSPRQKEDLEALLIEMQVEGMWTSTRAFEIRGRDIPQQERYDRIAAVVGDQKLVEFIALEENLAAYGETQAIASLLRRRSAPLTQTQRDGVFEILVEVRERYPMTPSAELDPKSLEYIEDRIRQLDEFDRHVVELAPSVLSATQVGHLFEAYDYMSRERIADVATQKKWRLEHPGADVGWVTPARWNPR